MANIVYFESLDKEAMEVMAALPQYALWHAPFQLIAQRKFPLLDNETDLDRQLDTAKRKVTRMEKLRDSARKAKETAQTALNAALETERKHEAEWKEALAERDTLSLKHAVAVALRSGATPVVPQATVLVDKPLSVVLEGQLALYKRELANSKEARRSSAAALATWNSKITSLRENIPADDEEGDEERERSPVRIGHLKTQLAEAEKRKVELTASIDKCAEKTAALESKVETFSKLAGDINTGSDSHGLGCGFSSSSIATEHGPSGPLSAFVWGRGGSGPWGRPANGGGL